MLLAHLTSVATPLCPQSQDFSMRPGSVGVKVSSGGFACSRMYTVDVLGIFAFGPLSGFFKKLYQGSEQLGGSHMDRLRREPLKGMEMRSPGKE